MHKHTYAERQFFEQIWLSSCLPRNLYKYQLSTGVKSLQHLPIFNEPLDIASYQPMTAPVAHGKKSTVRGRWSPSYKALTSVTFYDQKSASTNDEPSAQSKVQTPLYRAAAAVAAADDDNHETVNSQVHRRHSMVTRDRRQSRKSRKKSTRQMRRTQRILGRRRRQDLVK